MLALGSAVRYDLEDHFLEAKGKAFILGKEHVADEVAVVKRGSGSYGS